MLLRFNGDSGMLGWAITLIFNPSGTSGSQNVSAGVYNNNSAGSNIYWVKCGTAPGGAGTMIMKGTYRISATSLVTFVVYPKQAQPVNMFQDSVNVSAVDMAYSSQIQYFHSNNNATRWAPSSIGIFCTSTAFSSGNVLMREVIKSSSYTF